MKTLQLRWTAGAALCLVLCTCVVLTAIALWSTSPVTPPSTWFSPARTTHYLLHGSLPPSRPVSGVIYILAHNLPKLQRALHALHQNFNCVFHYPIVLFVDPAFKDVQHKLEQWMDQQLFSPTAECFAPQHQRFGSDTEAATAAPDRPYSVQIAVVDLMVLPFWLSLETVPKSETCPYDGGSYRWMCRWQAMLAQDRPELDSFDYYWRLDDDSIIDEPITYDLFSYMSQHDLRYAFAALSWEFPECAVDLHNDTLTYAAALHINSTATLAAWPEFAYAYNNFEVGRLDFWRSDSVRSILNELDRSNKLWKHRWGDAPIRTNIALLILPPAQVHLFNDIGYSHQGTRYFRMGEQRALQIVQAAGLSRSLDTCRGFFCIAAD